MFRVASEFTLRRRVCACVQLSSVRNGVLKHLVTKRDMVFDQPSRLPTMSQERGNADKYI